MYYIQLCINTHVMHTHTHIHAREEDGSYLLGLPLRFLIKKNQAKSGAHARLRTAVSRNDALGKHQIPARVRRHWQAG